MVVCLVIEHCDVHLGPVRHQNPSRSQPLVPRVDDRIEHGLIEQEVPHPLRDDDIHMFNWQFNLLDQSIDDGDPIRESILCDDVPTVDVDAGLLDAVDMLGPTLG